jgi:hypothetical protein
LFRNQLISKNAAFFNPHSNTTFGSNSKLDYPGHKNPLPETKKTKGALSSQEAAGKKLASQDVAKGHENPDGVW